MDGGMLVCFSVIEKIMTYAQCGFLSSSKVPRFLAVYLLGGRWVDIMILV